MITNEKLRTRCYNKANAIICSNIALHTKDIDIVLDDNVKLVYALNGAVVRVLNAYGSDTGIAIYAKNKADLDKVDVKLNLNRVLVTLVEEVTNPDDIVVIITSNIRLNRIKRNNIPNLSIPRLEHDASVLEIADVLAAAQRGQALTEFRSTAKELRLMLVTPSDLMVYAASTKFKHIVYKGNLYTRESWLESNIL